MGPAFRMAGALFGTREAGVGQAQQRSVRLLDQIEAYMELKWEEVYAFEHTPHPIEFQMYYSV